MNIRLYLIASDEEFNRLSHNWAVNECTSAACKATSNAADVLVSQGVYGRGFSNNVIALPYSQFKNAEPNSVAKWGLQSAPVVIFYDEDGQNMLSFLKGSQITESAIVQRYKELKQYTPGSQNGIEGYIDPQGEFHPLSSFVERTVGLPFGFSLPLFDLGSLLPNLRIPAWLWLVASGYCAFKMLELGKDRRVSKVVWGGLSGVALINYQNSKKRTTA